MIDLKTLSAKIFTKQHLLIFAGVLVCFLVIVWLFDFLVMPWYTKHDEALTVPNVIAQPFETAKDLLEMQGLKVIQQGEMHDSNLPFGYVVDQNPRSNRLVKKGRRVYLTISVGEREIEAPNLVGMSETNAEETLKSFGLRLGELDYRYVPDELPKVVVEQSVSPKTFVKANTAIDITVSLGEPVANVVVPSVLGKNFETARREIQRAGLMLGRISYRINSDLLPNTVIDQSMEAGLTIAYGDTINLVISSIPKIER
jgi:serine/threonine-protein kinase